MKVIAVSEKASFWKQSNINASIIAFDKIYIPQGQEPIDRETLELDLFNKNFAYEDVEYLESRDIVVQNPLSHRASDIVQNAVSKIREHNTQVGGLNDETKLVFGNFLERLFIEELSQKSNDIFIPSSEMAINLPLAKSENKSNIFTAIIENMPIISDEVPLDEVISFKEEHSSDYKKLMLWASKQNNAAGDQISTDELSELIENFRKYAEIGELKFRASTVEVIFQGAGLFKDALSLKFGKVSKTLATIRQSKADLMLHEINNPNLPLSYIVKAQDQLK